MAITLGAVTLPDGLTWDDEHAWEPLVQQVNYCFGGSLVVQESPRLAGRPITLVGGQRWAWVTRSYLLSLRSVLDAPGVELLLTLHDGREFATTPRRDGAGALVARPVPAIAGVGVADPDDDTKYILEQLRLMEI